MMWYDSVITQTSVNVTAMFPKMSSFRFVNTCGFAFIILCIFFVESKSVHLMTQGFSANESEKSISENKSYEDSTDFYENSSRNNSFNNETIEFSSEPDVFRKIQIDKFQREVFKRLGIQLSDTKPNGLQTYGVPPYIKSLFELMLLHDDDIKTDGYPKHMDQAHLPTINVYRSVIDTGQSQESFRFNISSLAKGTNITRSELVLNVNSSRQPTINVTFMPTDGKPEQSLKFERVATEQVVIADITDMVKEHTVHYDNITFWADSLSVPIKDPLIVVFENVDVERLANQPKRTKRHSDDWTSRLNKHGTNVNRNESTAQTAESLNICRAVPWEIHFEEIGWADWINFPSKYSANMCVGNCPPIFIDSYLNASNYAYMKNLYHVKTDFRHNERVPEACCSPVVYASQSIMYYNRESELVAKTIPDMRVMSCGCR